MMTTVTFVKHFLRSRADSLRFLLRVVLNEWLSIFITCFEYSPEWCTYSAVCLLWHCMLKSQMLMDMITQESYTHTVKICTESWLWEKSLLLHQGIEPTSALCLAGFLVQCSINWAILPSLSAELSCHLYQLSYPAPNFWLQLIFTKSGTTYIEDLWSGAGGDGFLVTAVHVAAAAVAPETLQVGPRVVQVHAQAALLVGQNITLVQQRWNSGSMQTVNPLS